jgi:hypothetical protein
MKPARFSGLRNSLATLGVIAVLAVIAGCASTPPSPPPVDESQLLAAGFKIVAAKTAQQVEHLRTLPAGVITQWQRTGVHYFVYPDTANSRIYVGTPKEYAAYQRLRPGNYPSLEAQEAANMASYEKQDTGMQNLTTRDLNDPYYFWDAFDGLGWR